MADTVSVTSLPIHNFRTGTDDPTVWLPLFEGTVEMCLHPADANAKNALLKKWFPLKVDDQARQKLLGITTQVWDEIKAAFIKSLVDPQEEYNWHARRQATITWDGVEPFHDLATKIRRAVDKYEPEAARQTEYFFRFRMALPKDYKREIDTWCPRDKRTIAEAKEIAERVRLANSEERAESMGAAAPAQPTTFIAAAMTGDRVEALERRLEGLSLRLGNMEARRSRLESQDRRRYSPDHRHHSPDRRRDSPNRKRDSPNRRRDSPDHRRHSPDRRRDSPDRRRHSPDRRRHSPDRRRDSPDCRRNSPYRRSDGPDRRYRMSDRLYSSPNRRYRSPDENSQDHGYNYLRQGRNSQDRGRDY